MVRSVVIYHYQQSESRILSLAVIRSIIGVFSGGGSQHSEHDLDEIESIDSII